VRHRPPADRPAFKTLKTKLKPIMKLSSNIFCTKVPKRQNFYPVEASQMGSRISTSIEKFFGQIFTRLSFISDALFPFFLSRFLNRQLSQWKDEGSIDDYKVEAERIQKFHYKIDVDFYLTPNQTKGILNKAVNIVSRRLRRWVYG
jgi:hypothetical protein